MPWRLQCKDCGAKAKLNVTDKPLKEACETRNCGGVMVPVVHRAGLKVTAAWEAAAAKRRDRAANQRAAARRAIIEVNRQLNEEKLLSDEKGEASDSDADDRDPLYLPSADFKPGMRLTTTGEAARQSFITSAGEKARTWHRVAAAAGRGNTQAVMGAKHGRSSLKATDWVDEQKQAAGTLEWEWCHLIGDCLGGATTHDNLVAGGYHANTVMMYIEMACKGRSDLEVQVTAALSAADVAERFTYEVRSASSAKVLLTRVIDSRTPGFARTNLDALTKDLEPLRRSGRR